MNNFFARFANDESGVTAIEYALIAAIVSAFLIVAVDTVTGGIQTAFTNVAADLTAR